MADATTTAPQMKNEWQEVTAEQCPFVERYLQAHDEAGLERVSLKPLLRRLADDPAAIDRPEGVFSAAWLGLDVSAMTSDNAERISANLLVSYLLQDFQPYLLKHLAQIKAQKDDLYSGLPRKLGVFPDEIQETYFREIRTASCDTFNDWVNHWLSDRNYANQKIRQAGGVPDGYGIALEQALRFFPQSALYAKANHTLASLLHSGSCTALHVCWTLIEAAAYNADLPTTADYVALIQRSRKNIMPLAIGSLGMVVTYLNNSHLHPHDGRAVHNTTHGQDGIVVEMDSNGDGVLTMNPRYVQPFLHGENSRYTGCPAFYVKGLIETYLEACTDLAAHYQMFRIAGDSRG
jgi:hypothetical protein